MVFELRHNVTLNTFNAEPHEKPVRVIHSAQRCHARDLLFDSFTETILDKMNSERGVTQVVSNLTHASASASIWYADGSTDHHRWEILGVDNATL